VLPDIITEKRGTRRRPRPVLVAACCAGLLLAVVALYSGKWSYSPGEKLVAPGVEDIAVCPKGTTSYPESDALRLDTGPEVVYVYLRVEDLSTGGGLEARVERRNRGPALARLFGGGGLRVLDEEEDRLGSSDGRISGVVRFAVRAESGGPLPAGDYTVEISAAGRGARVPLAKKYFVIGN
jgi:hypothetical protein